MAERDTAFEVFTSSMHRWWPSTHTIGEGKLAAAVLERRVGGRWYGRDEDGGETDWGYVLVWEPPERLILAWRINGNTFDATLHTEVEITFQALDVNITEVRLEHRFLERISAKDARTNIDNGWTVVLEHYKRAAQRSVY